MDYFETCFYPSFWRWGWESFFNKVCGWGCIELLICFGSSVFDFCVFDISSALGFYSLYVCKGFYITFGKDAPGALFCTLYPLSSGPFFYSLIVLNFFYNFYAKVTCCFFYTLLLVTFFFTSACFTFELPSLLLLLGLIGTV